MSTPGQFSRLNLTLAGLLAAMLFTSAITRIQAGEVQILNSNFDDLAPSPAWAWENWSRPGSTVTYDAALNAAGGAAGSGSLRISGPFDPANTGWQEAVFTLDITDFDPSLLHSLSFDVKVDPASIPRAAGDYGNIQVILRQGNNWEWRQQTMIPLTSTSWRRVTVLLASGEQPINDIRAITVRIAQNGMAGTVTANIDNIAFTEEITFDNFDDGNIDGWTATWGTTPEVTYSPLDRYGRETSGSLRVAGTFTPSTSWQQAVVTVPFPAPVDAAALYTHINVDVKVDPGSTLSSGNNYGLFEIKTPSGSPTLGGAQLTSTEWTHFSFELAPGIGSLNGLIIQLGGGDFLGPITYNLDNLSWTKRLAPPPPPTLSIQKAAGGLNLVHTSTDQYGRHNIYSADSSALGFYDQFDPVSYSFTIQSFPDAAAFPGFQTHMFLVPGGGGSETSPDWNQPNIIFLDVRAGANGSGSCTFRWKTNQANGNSQLYAGGLPVVNSTTVRGTWTLRASGNTHFVMTAPDGTSTSLDLSPEAAAAFSGALRFYVGVQGNSPNNIGQRMRLGGIRITKGETDDTVLLEDTFSGDALDTTKWVANATAGGVQFLRAADAGFLLTWGLPDDGFSLQWRDSLGDDAFVNWTPVSAAPYALGPLRRQVQVPPSELLDFNQAFFRLIKP